MQEIQAEISVTNVKKNIALFRERIGDKKLYAVVKSNAYGHGAEEVSLRIEEEVDGFCVATVKEGIALRAAGVEKDILVFTPPLSLEDVLFAYRHNLILSLASLAAFSIINRAVEEYGVGVRVHIKVNTGMNRAGLSSRSLVTLCKRAKAVKNIVVEGVYSHLYYPSDRAISTTQRERFLALIKVVEGYFGRIERHLSATGGVAYGKDFYFDGVRIGIGLYGYFPDKVKRYLPVFRAMKVYAPVVQTRGYFGGGVGYNLVKKEYKDLSFIRLGYADGFPRYGGVCGAVGNLCMDGAVVEGRKYKRVLVFDNAEKLAKQQNTIACEVLINATRRAEMNYV